MLVVPTKVVVNVAITAGTFDASIVIEEETVPYPYKLTAATAN
jgi:hypothetical protein